MKRTGHFALVPFALILLGACGGSSGSPIGPTASVTRAPPPVTPVPASPASGRITDVSIKPDAGTTMNVRDCELSDGTTRTRVCAEQFRGLFEVVASRRVPYPVLTVGFYDGSQMCGYAAATADALVAGEALSFSASAIFLSWEQWDATGSRGIVQPCKLPLTTTRIVAELWSDADDFSLKREYSNSYVFRRP